MSTAQQMLETSQRQFVPATSLTRRLGWVGLLSALVVAAGIYLAPDRSWPSLLITAVYLVGLPIGAMIFLSTQAVASGGWHVCFKRIPESIAATLPWAGLVLLLTLAGGMGTLFEWSHADVVANDPILAGKSQWLNVPFFLARAIVVLGVWLAFVAALLRISRRQDTEQTPAGNRRTVTLSALFLVVLAITFSVASWDWLMSLEAHWFSTVFAAYHFTGSFVSSLAMITVAAIVLRRRGSLRGIVTEAHLQDMGKLLLGLSSFWAYLWLCQYLLIWYGNLPEEVTFYMHRHHGAWAVVSGANVMVGWVVPFLALLPRAAKRNEGFLLKAAGLLLVGHWIDLYYSIQPVFQPEAPVLGIWELAPIVGATALFLWAFRRGLAAAGLIPLGDAYLQESLHHHQ
jgi:hypothetical protein